MTVWNQAGNKLHSDSLEAPVRLNEVLTILSGLLTQRIATTPQWGSCVVRLFALAAVAFLGCGFMLYALSQWMLETDSGDDTGKPTSATGAATAHESWSSVERSRLGQRSLVISRETSEEAVRSFSLLICTTASGSCLR
jgi:hypothetical protein